MACQHANHDVVHAALWQDHANTMSIYENDKFQTILTNVTILIIITIPGILIPWFFFSPDPPMFSIVEESIYVLSSFHEAVRGTQSAQTPKEEVDEGREKLWGQFFAGQHEEAQ
jgi:hypothetical protein